MLERVGQKLSATINEVLRVAEGLQARSMTIPALSGGIFTHKTFDENSHILHEKEHKLSRHILVQTLASWAALQSRTLLCEIVVITPAASGRRAQQAMNEAQMLIDALSEIEVWVK